MYIMFQVAISSLEKMSSMNTNPRNIDDDQDGI